MTRPARCLVAAAVLPFVPASLLLAVPSLGSHLPGLWPVLVYFSGVFLGAAALVYEFELGGILIAVIYVPGMLISLTILAMPFVNLNDWP
jgi:Na+/pantothenate symporter